MMFSRLRKKPWYLFLLPLFFVGHGYAQNFGFISLPAAGILFVVFLFAAVVLFSIFFVVFKSWGKAALVSMYLLGFYFFFGALQDFFRDHIEVLARYSVLLTLFVLGFAGVFTYLYKTKRSFSKLSYFLNLLLIIFIIVDAAEIMMKLVHPPADKPSVYSFGKNEGFSSCADCDKPDIYFLLFDEYASSASLTRLFNFDNSELDTFLTQQGFKIQTHSRSNYNFTSFSMASVLNMSYLSGVDRTQVTIGDYSNSNSLIKSNLVMKMLSTHGYEIVNLSIFDLAGHPSMIDQNFLPLKTKLITDETLFSRMQKDLGWILFTGKFKIKWLSDKLFYHNMHNNNAFLGKAVQVSTVAPAKPRFIYAHFFMPHPPFYFNKRGLPKGTDVVYTQSKEMNTGAYMDYIGYTNLRIKELISRIMENTKKKAVIILMADHGFRKAIGSHSTAHFFDIQNAVFFPDRSYGALNDSITGVNQFRIIFNKLFVQNLPLLKDSTIFLVDKK